MDPMDLIKKLPRPALRKPRKRETTPVVQPPPEALPRVDGGGPWGPSDFDLPDPAGNRRAIILVSVTGGLVLLALLGFLTVFYFHVT
jgi:hypothetical protein